jgi:Ca2+-binding RTX toxin-like protein
VQRRSDIEKLESRIMLQGVVFDSHVDYGVGDDPLGIAVGDFNGDGKLDLAVPNRTDDNVSVLLGNGDGTFQSTNEFGAGYYPDAVTVGDFAGDGVLDLVTANSLGSAIGVLVGNGDGTFQPQLRQQVGCMPESVAVGDLNNDGMPDIVAANFADSTVSVLMDQGVVSGTLSFAPQAVYPVGPAGVTMQPSSVAVADLTGNGINDIITADLKIGEVSVLMGNGDGTFQAPITFKCGNDPESVAVADLNGDGIPDIITADSIDRSVDVLLGKGMRNGVLKFKPAEALYLGDRPRYSPLAVAVGDFNGDGIEDIAVAEGGVSYVSGYTVAVLLGNGNGTFQAPVVLNVGYQPTAIAVGDFTGDGRPDIAVSDSGASEISVLINETPIIQNIQGTLTILGTNNADTATVTEQNGTLTANLDGTVQTFAESSVTSIILNMGGGNDSVTIGPGVPEVLVDGGGGNDSIVAQNHAPNTLMGGNGNDTIIGGGGPELLEGGAGNDSVVGGIGADKLIGGTGNDTLISGSGDSTLNGNQGNDSLLGIGMDLLNPGPGSDTVSGT